MPVRVSMVPACSLNPGMQATLGRSVPRMASVQTAILLWAVCIAGCSQGVHVAGGGCRAHHEAYVQQSLHVFHAAGQAASSGAGHVSGALLGLQEQRVAAAGCQSYGCTTWES
jgi:hypothetical protein